MQFLKLFLKKYIPSRYYPLGKVIYFYLKSLWYLGRKVQCPFCKGRFREFVKTGPDMVCPRCDFRDRYRLLWLYLGNRTNFFRDNLKVLDIGPAYFFQKKCITMPNLNYISADISSSMSMVKIDITNMSLMDNQFDCIICYHVLEHIVDDQQAMSELFRVLKPGGWAILQSPVDVSLEQTFEDICVTSPQERKRLFGQEDHVRRYGRDYVGRLEKAGFKVKIDTYVRQLEKSLIEKYGLDIEEDIYFCSKL